MPPTIALTMGDPAGIGPEIIVGAWRELIAGGSCRPFAVGHPVFLREAAALRRLDLQVQLVAGPEEARPQPQVIPCVQTSGDDVLAVRHGEIDARAGEAAYAALVAAADWALNGRIDALVTAPLHKVALDRAGHHYPGHTEILAERCGVADFAMMLYLAPDERVRGPAGLGVVHVTLHTALRNVFGELSSSAIFAKARLVDGVMRVLKGSPPRLAVCALNPHAGEGGLFGDEELRLIAPAVERAQAAGLDVVGPLPADTLMLRAAAGEFDGVVAMYHDQGHIALKLLGMHRAVNVTLGLPIVRTSVAHGTAFDLAWQGRAETGGMVEAVRVAALLADERRAREGGQWREEIRSSKSEVRNKFEIRGLQCLNSREADFDGKLVVTSNMQNKTRFDRLPKRDREEILRIDALHSSWADSPEAYVATALQNLRAQCQNPRASSRLDASSLLASSLHSLKAYFCDRGIVRRFLDDDVEQLRIGVDTSARLGFLMWTAGGIEYSGGCDCGHVFDLLVALAASDESLVNAYLQRFPAPFRSGNPATVLLSNGLYAILQRDRTLFATLEERLRTRTESRFFRAMFDCLLGIAADDASQVAASIGEMIHGNRRQEQMNSPMEKLICLHAHALYNVCVKAFAATGVKMPAIPDQSAWDADFQRLVQSSASARSFFDLSSVNPLLQSWMNELPERSSANELLAHVS